MKKKECKAKKGRRRKIRKEGNTELTNDGVWGMGDPWAESQDILPAMSCPEILPSLFSHHKFQFCPWNMTVPIPAGHVCLHQTDDHMASTLLG